MLIRYQDLATLAATTEDGTRHAVRDLLVEGQDLRPASVVVDVGGWFDDRTARVSLDRFGTPDTGGSRWPVRLVRSDLAESPAPTAGGTPAAAPVWLDAAADDPPAGRDDDGLNSVADLLADAEVVAPDGPAGTLMDLIFDTDGWRLASLVVGTGGERLPKHQRVVPADALDSFDPPARRLSLSIPAERVHASPDLHEMDGLEGKWYTSVLAYYGLAG
jgi:hypothetical protein